jgi:peroxin-6
MLKAVTRQATAVDAKIKAINDDPATRNAPISTAYYFDHHATPQDLAVSVLEEDFLAANDELIPSVSAGELAHYEKVRATFEGGRGAAQGQSSRPAPVASGQSSRPAPVASGQRMASTSSSTSKTGGSRGKGKAVVSGKGKGKAVATGSDDEWDSDEVGGSSRAAGKAVATGFQHGTASDDEGLY